jgi:hypothetical protein
MAEVLRDAQQDFWRSPASLKPVEEPLIPVEASAMADACGNCGSEYLIAAKFCHVCGVKRTAASKADTQSDEIANLWSQMGSWARPAMESGANWLQRLSFPDWLRYLHFHEIKHRVGLPMASFIAFIIGLGCIAGAVGVSLFYKASNLAEFQAIQLWRIEWLLAAAASFLAAIVLKNPSAPGND